MSGTSIPAGTSPYVANLQFSGYQDLINRSVAVAQLVCPELTDFSPGSPSLALMSVRAYSDLWLQWLIFTVFLNARFFTATGPALDTWGADFGYSRSAATYATGYVTFSRYSGTNVMVIPVGTICQTQNGTQKFITLADTTNVLFDIPSQTYIVPAGTLSITIFCQAVNSGIQGNVLASTITLMYSSVAGINSVTNSAAMSGGVNGQSDPSFQAGFIPYFNSRSAGTGLAIVNAIQSISTNLTYQILENANGVIPDPNNNNAIIPDTQFGFFTVYIDSGLETATPAAVVQQISQAINAVRGLSIDYWVTTPAIVPINIEYLLNYQPGYLIANVQAIVNAAITNYVNTIQPGAQCNYYKLAALINDTLGVKSVQFLIVAGVESNVGVAPGSILKLGTLAGA